MEYKEDVDQFPPDVLNANLTFSKSELSNLEEYEKSIRVDDIPPDPTTG